jgi:hypothetical protein
MSPRGSFRRSLSVVLLASVALLPLPAGAQATDERLRALEAEVAALKTAVAAAQASPATAELARRIDALAAELEKLKLGEAVIEADRGQAGMGPAASKVYRKAKGVSIGGYGEMLYQDPDGTRDDGAASEKDAQLDLLRGVLYVGYKWNEQWLFNTELEWEHAKVGEEAEGEAAVEFAYVERSIRPEINARAGLLLVPMGLLNELHEPTTYLGAKRPGVDTVILPSTWRENGAGVLGEIGGWSYRTYVLAGLDASGFSAAKGIREGRQEGSESSAESLAWVGRLDWTATPGLVAGASLYYGDSGQGIRSAGGRELGVATRIAEAHVDWKSRGFSLRGLFADVALDDVADLNAALGLAGSESIGERQRGYYLEAGYDLLARRGGRQSLTPFARWESYDTQDRVPAGYARDAANDVDVLTLGLAWKPIDQVVFKADWTNVDNGAGTGVDQLNLALGWVF